MDAKAGNNMETKMNISRVMASRRGQNFQVLPYLHNNSRKKNHIEPVKNDFGVIGFETEMKSATTLFKSSKNCFHLKAQAFL